MTTSQSQKVRHAWVSRGVVNGRWEILRKQQGSFSGVVVHASSPSSGNAKEGCEFESSLGYMGRPCLEGNGEMLGSSSVDRVLMEHA